MCSAVRLGTIRNGKGWTAPKRLPRLMRTMGADPLTHDAMVHACLSRRARPKSNLSRSCDRRKN